MGPSARWTAGAWTLAALAAFATPARAAVSCTIVNTTGVAFGSYDGTRTAPLDSAGAVAFRCGGIRRGETATVMIQLSRGDSGSYLPRAMVRPSNRLEYNLYLDAARTTVWGDGTAGTSVSVTQPPNGRTVSVPIFGRIPPRQIVSPDQYADLIVVTLLY